MMMQNGYGWWQTSAGVVVLVVDGLLLSTYNPNPTRFTPSYAQYRQYFADIWVVGCIIITLLPAVLVFVGGSDVTADGHSTPTSIQFAAAFLPCFVSVIILIIRPKWMSDVEHEMQQLERMQYRLKGA